MAHCIAGLFMLMTNVHSYARINYIMLIWFH